MRAISSIFMQKLFSVALFPLVILTEKEKISHKGE